MLKAKTKGKLFSKGGELVEFRINEKSIGKNLSGGDGVAYKAYIPKKAGLYTMRAAMDDDEDTGLLLSLRKGSGIVFIDVEGALLKASFSRKAREGSQEAVKAIRKRSAVVFLQRGLFGLDLTREWLRENEFTALPVVPWRKGAVFEEVVEKGLKVEAVIGAPKVIESAREHTAMSFSFEQAEGAEWVGHWDEIEKKLNECRK